MAVPFSYNPVLRDGLLFPYKFAYLCKVENNNLELYS